MPISVPHRALATLSLLLTLAACASDPPVAPDPTAPQLRHAAFLLSIDVTSGRVTVTPPLGAGRVSRAGGPSLSLIGSDGIAVHATDCTWGAAGSNKQKRCTFDLAIENRMPQTDLVPPTTFPSAAPGLGGILVFPFAAAGLGTSGSTAIPTSDWDNPPANFFNDFAGCSSRTDDCYRSESYPAPLLAGATSAPRRVGFDVDKNAQSVSVYVVVAADLRDAARELLLQAVPLQCGTVAATGNPVLRPHPLFAGWSDFFNATLIGYCGFQIPAGVHVVEASLLLAQSSVVGTPFADGTIVVDHINFGATLTSAVASLAALKPDIAVLSAGSALGYKSVDVTQAVRADLLDGRTHSKFRVRFTPEVTSGIVRFDGPEDEHPPLLVLRVRPDR